MSSKPGAFLSPGISPPDTWLLGGRRPAYRGREADPGFCVELREPVVPMPREKHKWHQPRGERTDAEHWDGQTCRSNEGQYCGWSKGVGSSRCVRRSTGNRRRRMNATKPF